ncbi:MAG: Mrp/NBP35 family ATP-binding protein [bacterium]|nr:Mrp/NBP35 family ATP-binding protein [bacterium]
MSLTTDQVLESLRRVQYPGFSRDIVSVGVVENVAVEDGAVRFSLTDPNRPEQLPQIEKLCRDALSDVAGVRSINVHIAGGAPASSPALPVVGSAPKAPPSVAARGALGSDLIPEVKHAVAVASGKGGVGKSTVAVNLAVSLAKKGARVGLLDADIYGPSIPIMMGYQGKRPELDSSGQRLIPFERHGVHFMSLGFLVDPESAVIWRGPLVMKALEQLLRDVVWGALDVLVIDLPPGTGDAQLTLSQRIRLAGAVIVSTPQDVALADAIKAVSMFRKVEVPILGLAENMSHFHCPHCSEHTDIFGHGGGRAQAERLGVPFLGEIPLDPALRDSGDSGTPIAVSDADTPASLAFSKIAETVLRSLAVDAPEGAGTIFERFRQVWQGPQNRYD